IYDVKSTRNLAPWIREHGGVPSLWKTGHSLIKARMRERGAALAGEMSGHTFFVERWYGFDDAQYAAARLLEILSKTPDATATLNALPDSMSTPELHLKLAEGEPHRLIEALGKSASFPGATEVIRLDGLRVEYADGFGLARASGRHRRVEIREAYLNRITSDVRLARPMKIAVDCGNGVAGATAGELYRRLGCEVLELYCEVDGRFPNHHPDPSHPGNLKDLIALVQRERREVGLAFDGDGDRLGVVTAEGKIIFPDRQLMLFAKDVLSRQPGAEIIYDVKSTRNLAPWIREHGGVPSLWKTGHSLIKARMRERGAALAGEMSGHTFFVERWYGFDDAQYAAARLLEILSKTPDATATLNALPDSMSTPELHLKLAEGEPHRLIEALGKSASFPGATEVIRLDGLRVEYADGFGLARASNTTPVIVLRFEAEDEAGLDRIKSEFRRVLLSAKPDAKLPF
ncbi:MAG: hypothetical protein E6H50_07730, partial [Betaproteobacteria bacterium]